MNRIIISTILFFCYSFSSAQSNTFIVGGQLGGTPYLATSPFAKGFHFQYYRNLSDKWKVGFALGNIVNKKTHSHSINGSTNGVSFEESFQYNDKEKTFYLESDLSYQLRHNSKYQLNLNFGASWLSNNFDYSKNIILKDYKFQSIDMDSTQRKVVMANLGIENLFHINEHIIIVFKSILRGQFRDQYAVDRTTINTQEGTYSESTYPLVLTASYSFILGIGFEF